LTSGASGIEAPHVADASQGADLGDGDNVGVQEAVAEGGRGFGRRHLDDLADLSAACTATWLAEFVVK